VRQRIDVEALKRAHPIAEVAARYGLAPRRSGRALVTRCPFHDDRGRPNLHLYPAADPARDGYWCFRCGARGDAIDLVAHLEGVPFLAAVGRLAARPPAVSLRGRRNRAPAPPPLVRLAPGPAERACLAAAVDLYAARLRGEPAALAYLAGRGLDRATVERHRLGYATGEDLITYLRWRGLPPGAALRVGLLRRDGREHLAGRIVVPELRAGGPVWLVGRTSASDAAGPTYLGLPGRKPLLGCEDVQDAPAVWLVEGIFDFLVLRMWGLPVLCLAGTGVGPAVVAALRRFPRLLLALDDDAAGRAATQALLRALGAAAVPVVLPGVGDPAELALVPDGRALLLRAAERALLAAAA
jgi:DNA primase